MKDENWNPYNINQQQPIDMDLEFLKKEISQRFPFYDMRFNSNTVAFFCRVDKESLEENFESLRIILSKNGYIPMLRKEHGEDIIYIIKKPRRKEKPIWVNIILLIATIITTILTGSLLNIGVSDIYSLENISEIFYFNNLVTGAAYFALPLMLILFIHEMGHYFISKKHNISASFPFFLPIPPIFPGFNIGTFGALISSREPMADKKSLFDIGIAGPLAGFIVAIPVTVIGIAMSEIVPIGNVASGETVLGNSILFSIITDMFHNIPKDYGLSMSLMAFAGWVGLLITSINLLPIGQLDGGHIFRAVFGNKQKYIAWAAFIIMVFTGWWFFAFVILMMTGSSHPPPLNDENKLDIKRKLLFISALLILIICFIPYPIYVIP